MQNKTAVIILDDNPISIAGYAEEFPENWKKICDALDKKEEEKDTWNLADVVHDMARNNIVKRSARVDDIKTFIQKVNEDFDKIENEKKRIF